MSFPDPIFRRRKRNQTPNLKLEDLTMNSLITLLTTSKGWLIRQAIKATAYITTPLTVWLEANGQGDHAAALTTGIVAAVSVLVELGLSYAARKNP
jgi:hypothetical protein